MNFQLEALGVRKRVDLQLIFTRFILNYTTYALNPTHIACSEKWHRVIGRFRSSLVIL